MVICINIRMDEHAWNCIKKSKTLISSCHRKLIAKKKLRLKRMLQFLLTLCVKFTLIPCRSLAAEIGSAQQRGISSWYLFRVWKFVARSLGIQLNICKHFTVKSPSWKENLYAFFNTTLLCYETKHFN